MAILYLLVTKNEIEILTKHFVELAPQMDKIDRSRFRDLLADTFGVDDSLIMDRVFRCFDLDADNYISFDEFMRGMSIFLKGRWEERLKFCFRVYDLNGDRYISKEEMFQMLKNCLVRGAEEDEDGVKDLVDLVLKKLDEDRDGRVSEADWNGAIAKETLLMEAFGQCLPTSKMVEMYLNPNPDENGNTGSGKTGHGNRLELPAKPTGNQSIHPASKHVHPHAMNGPRRVVVAPAAGSPSVSGQAAPPKAAPVKKPGKPVAA
ncbi:EF-hand calcium-binding domain-containing protein 1 [Blyttiomyces sp. JEL0837]|nr:EF-hand calcium-binding domain-containing protein 1 [Blyttiomyces sp. JEL0837]